MNRFLLNTTCAFLLCFAPVAFADDDGGKSKKKAKSSGPVDISTVEVVREESDEKESNSSGKVTIEINATKHEFGIGDQRGEVVKKIHVIKDGDHETSIVIGHGVIVGPDGKKKEFKLGDPAASKEMLKNLPEEIRKRVEKAMKDSSKGSIFGQGVMIGPDGVKKAFKLGDSPQFSEALKNLPEEARKEIEQAIKGAGEISIRSSGSRGRAIVIGRDGVRKEYKLGDGNSDDIDAETFEDLRRTLRFKTQSSNKEQSSSNEKSGDALAEKLDAILKRLDNIEKEIQTLKEAK